MLRDRALVPLSRDHQHALALCVRTDRALAAGKLSPQAHEVVAKFDSEMRAHFDLEEQVLFPALAAVPSLTNLITELTDDHRQIAVLVDKLRTGADERALREFSTLLEQHVRKEERVLFEEAQRLLSREQLDEIGQHI